MTLTQVHKQSAAAFVVSRHFLTECLWLQVGADSMFDDFEPVLSQPAPRLQLEPEPEPEPEPELELLLTQPEPDEDELVVISRRRPKRIVMESDSDDNSDDAAPSNSVTDLSAEAARLRPICTQDLEMSASEDESEEEAALARELEDLQVYTKAIVQTPTAAQAPTADGSTARRSARLSSRKEPKPQTGARHLFADDEVRKWS